MLRKNSGVVRPKFFTFIDIAEQTVTPLETMEEIAAFSW
jgi:hypothetical protein